MYTIEKHTSVFRIQINRTITHYMVYFAHGFQLLFDIISPGTLSN